MKLACLNLKSSLVRIMGVRREQPGGLCPPQNSLVPTPGMSLTTKFASKRKTFVPTYLFKVVQAPSQNISGYGNDQIHHPLILFIFIENYNIIFNERPTRGFACVPFIILLLGCICQQIDYMIYTFNHFS